MKVKVLTSNLKISSVSDAVRIVDGKEKPPHPHCYLVSSVSNAAKSSRCCLMTP